MPPLKAGEADMTLSEILLQVPAHAPTADPAPDEVFPPEEEASATDEIRARLRTMFPAAP